MTSLETHLQRNYRTQRALREGAEGLTKEERMCDKEMCPNHEESVKRLKQGARLLMNKYHTVGDVVNSIKEFGGPEKVDSSTAEEIYKRLGDESPIVQPEMVEAIAQVMREDRKNHN